MLPCSSIFFSEMFEQDEEDDDDDFSVLCFLF